MPLRRRFNQLLALLLGGGAVLAQPLPPEAFGYKMSWLAVRSDDANAVLEALALKKPRAASWQAGIKAAYDGAAFVSPVVRGWVLVVAPHLPEPNAAPGQQALLELLRRLSQRFGETHFYASHRGVSYAAWARAKAGQVERAFSFVPEMERPWQLGEADAAEQALDLPARDFFADEDDVVRLAAAWSLDPTVLDREPPTEAKGWIGELPRTR